MALFGFVRIPALVAAWLGTAPGTPWSIDQSDIGFRRISRFSPGHQHGPAVNRLMEAARWRSDGLGVGRTSRGCARVRAQGNPFTPYRDSVPRPGTPPGPPSRHETTRNRPFRRSHSPPSSGGLPNAVERRYQSEDQVYPWFASEQHGWRQARPSSPARVNHRRCHPGVTGVSANYSDSLVVGVPPGSVRQLEP